MTIVAILVVLVLVLLALKLIKGMIKLAALAGIVLLGLFFALTRGSLEPIGAGSAHYGGDMAARQRMLGLRAQPVGREKDYREENTERHS